MSSLARSVPFTALVCLAFAAAAAPPAEDGWAPLDPEHLALERPRVQADADAEVLFWDMRFRFGFALIETHRIRIKTFTERGAQAIGQMHLPFEDARLEEIAARTILPDGTIVELQPNDVIERSSARSSGFHLRTKSFVVPALEPGSILDLRLRIVHGIGHLAAAIPMQAGIPIQQLRCVLWPRELSGGGVSTPRFGARGSNVTQGPLQTYSDRSPISVSGTSVYLPNPHGRGRTSGGSRSSRRAYHHHLPSASLHLQTFGMQPISIQKDPHGSIIATATDVPAFESEPHMPPEDQIRNGLLAYYVQQHDESGPEHIWTRFGTQIHEALADHLKPRSRVRKAARDAVARAATAEQKLERLFELCRTRIRNVPEEAGAIASSKKGLTSFISPEQTVQRGTGTREQINLLFAALATAAGFEVRPALLPDRSTIFFRQDMACPFLMRSLLVAVRQDGGWRLYDPGTADLPPDMLRWQEESQDALVSDPHSPVFVKTPLTPPERSKRTGTATLRLGPDGTLEGEVRIEYSGHLAMAQKALPGEAAAEVEKRLVELVQSRLPGAEVGDVRIENVTGAGEPLVHAYRIQVPGFALRSGTRLMLRPAFFQHGLEARFPASERKHPIYFAYPWSEADTIRIELPEGFELEDAWTPAALAVRDVLDHDAAASLAPDGRTLEYRRRFTLRSLIFPARSYPGIKRAFDGIHSRDTHTLVLWQAGAGGSRQHDISGASQAGGSIHQEP
jgi:hypothetical protein